MQIATAAQKARKTACRRRLALASDWRNYFAGLPSPSRSAAEFVREIEKELFDVLRTVVRYPPTSAPILARDEASETSQRPSWPQRDGSESRRFLTLLRSLAEQEKGG
jgi:hypothetical protein